MQIYVFLFVPIVEMTVLFWVKKGMHDWTLNIYTSPK